MCSRDHRASPAPLVPQSPPHPEEQVSVWESGPFPKVAHTWSPLLGTRHSGRLLFEGHLVQVPLCAAQRGHLQKQLSLSPHSGLKGLEYLP